MKISRKSFFYRVANSISFSGNKLPERPSICVIFWKFVLNIFIGFPMGAACVLFLFLIAAMMEIGGFVLTGKSFSYDFYLYKKSGRTDKNFIFRNVPYMRFKYDIPVPGSIIALAVVGNITRHNFGRWVVAAQQISASQILSACFILVIIGVSIWYFVKVDLAKTRNEALGTFRAILLSLKAIKEKACFLVEIVD